MFEQRTRSEAIDVSPNMRGISRGSSEVGGGVDVGISFEENLTVARFYWLSGFESPTTTSLISASSGPEPKTFSHELYVKITCINNSKRRGSKITSW